MVDCTYTAPSRKPNPKQRRGHAGISGDGIRSSEERFEHLEALLEQLNERLSVSEQRTEVQTQAQAPRPFTRLTLPTISTIEDGHADYTGSSQKYTSLPPLQQVLPIVQIFLDKFNSVLPLFHAQTLLRLVHEFYSLSPQQRDPVAWAAINVVLALAHRHAMVGDSDPSHSVEYLSRAQSVLSSVILGDTQLLNIQVLVGMVMLLQGAQDQQPPLILIATTMRLAHKIGLHTRASLMHLDPVLAQQRVCVFWIAYILDKDISMRSMQPSIQLDDDIDLDLPFHNGDEYQSDDASISAGLVATADGAVQMQYFLTRIQLAVIEGGVYDYLFSTRSGKRSPDERARALDSVARALEQWKASIPREFSPTAAILEAPLDSLCFLGILHSTSLLCTTLVNHAHAWNPEWTGSLRRSAKYGTPPLLPPMWESVVDEARSLLALFEALPVTDRSNFWLVPSPH